MSFHSLRGGENIFSGEAHTNAMSKDLRKKAGYLLFGLLAGAANGLFGGGGGMLVVPCLTYLGKSEEKRAHATAIALVLPLSLISATVYTLRCVHDFSLAWKVGLGVSIGGAIGAFLLRKVPKGVLTFLFYGVMIYAGVRFVL